MPNDPIDYLVVKGLQTSLKAMSTSAGYHYTVKGLAVKLDKNHEVEKLIPGANPPLGPPRPFLVLDMTPGESWTYAGSAKQLLLEPRFIVHAIHNSDPTEDDSRDKTYFRLCADVEKALAANLTLGLNEVNYVEVTGRQMRKANGQEVWAMIAGVVRERRIYGSPNAA